MKSEKTFLSEKEKNKLINFLTDLGYAEDQYEEKPILFFKEYTDNDKTYKPVLQKDTLDRVFRYKKKELLFNLFILINSGKLEWQTEPFKHCVEGRKKFDIVRYNAFMLDFDLKDENQKHYKGKELRKKKSELLKKIWYKLPLRADYIVESRNGFHVYYLISKPEKRMSAEKWHKIEIGIFDYVKENISDKVDYAVKKSNQIMRLPYSIHKKDDNEDEGFQVKIIYERNRKLKEEFFAEEYNETDQLLYRTNKIIKSFQIDMNKIIKNQNKKIRTFDKIREDKIIIENISEELKILTDKYSVTKAISERDTNYFEYLRKNKNNGAMSRQEATEYIRKIDLREILGFNEQKLNAGFSSLFYEDKNPSDYFKSDENGRVSYYCRRENHFYNSIFEIVYRLSKFDNEMSEQEKWKEVYEFVYEINGIKLITGAEENKREFDRARQKNIEILSKTANHSKNTKYLKKFVMKLYEELMQIWEEHSEKYKLAWREMHKTVSVNYLADKMGRKKGDSKISKGLLILESIGVIERAEGKYQIHENIPTANEYRFCILREENISELTAGAEMIKANFNKPLNEVTRKKLEEIEKK